MELMNCNFFSVWEKGAKKLVTQETGHEKTGKKETGKEETGKEETEINLKLPDPKPNTSKDTIKLDENTRKMLDNLSAINFREIDEIPSAKLYGAFETIRKNLGIT